jgi:uncharacterized membrane protein
MKQQRLDGLADGIFAIVITFLAFELKLPLMDIGASDRMIWIQIIKLLPSFLSLIISFALLFTYWRAHHFIASMYAKNLTVGLANINAIFFFLIILVPFSSSLLGTHPSSKVSIAIYGFNVIMIGLCLYFMRRHIELDPKIETSVITKADRRSGYIRILFPVFSASLAIILSYWNTNLSIIIFAVSIIFNLVPESSNIIHKWLDILFSDDADIIEGNYAGKVDIMSDEEYICVPKKIVFDHHRFQSFEKKSKRPITKREKKEIKLEEKVEKRIENEIEAEVKKGDLEDVIKKGEIKTENE